MLKFLLGSAAVATTLLLSQPSKAQTFLGLDPLPWNISGASVLTLSPTVPAGNQVSNIPCIICGAHQPQQPSGFGYNLFGNTGNADTVSFFSTAVVPTQGGSGLAIDQLGTGYSLAANSAFLAALAGRTDFNIGIDVNDTNDAQTLESFWFLNLTQHLVLAVFSPGPGGTLIPGINDGTGFPDYTLSGFDINRGDILPGDQIIFFARITGANDGPDSFFLMPVPSPIAGAGLPGLLAAFGVGGFMWRRRKTA
jgi:hypothetical protein